MIFKVGDTVVYPHHGAALIEAIETRTIKGEPREYLVLKVAQGDLTVRVPADNAEYVGVRDVVGQEGLDKVFTDAGFEWREPGCSACLAMNPDKVPPGERCASTSNRNFVGRQGPGSRTHLVSPAMAAAAAVTGRLADVRNLAPCQDGAA